MVRYFKKFDPRQAILLSHGGWHRFHGTGEWGVEATDNAWLIREFETAIKQHRGGIEEITRAEYDSLNAELKKKTKRSKPFNEALNPRQIQRWFAGRGKSVARVGAAAVSSFLRATDLASRNLARPMSANTDFRPASVKR